MKYFQQNPRFAVLTSMLLCLAVFTGSATAQLTWSKRTSGTNATLRTVAFGNNMYVTAGDSGMVLTSTNGTTWTKRTVGSSKCFFKGAVYLNNKFVLVADSVNSQYTLCPYLSFVSTDGITWSRGVIASGYSTTITSLQSDIAAGNNEFLAIHSYASTTTSCQIFSSTNGQTWTYKSTLTPYALNAMCYGKNTYVIGGLQACYSSSDDSLWINRSSTGINDVIFANTQFVACGTGIKTSSDGMTWVSKNTAITGLKSLAYGQLYYIAAGVSGTIAISTDAATWTATKPVDTNSLNSITYGNNLMVAIGNNGKIITTTILTTKIQSHSVNELPYSPSFSLSGLQFTLPYGCMVQAKLYDVRGHFVAMLVSSFTHAGAHRVVLPAHLSAGHYLLSFQAGNSSFVKPVIIVR